MLVTTGSDIYEYVANRMNWKKSDGSTMGAWSTLSTSDQAYWNTASGSVNAAIRATLPDGGPPDPG